MTSQTQPRTAGFLLKAYPRLSEAFILQEILLLEKLGWHLHIFAMRNPDEPEVHEQVGRVRARVTYIPDDVWRNFLSLLTSNLRLGWRHPFRFWRPLRFALARTWRRRNTSTLKRFVQAGYLVERGLPGSHVSHLHAHFSHDPTTVAFFASWLTGISYSFSAHAKDIYLEEPGFLREKIARARFVVTCTEYNKNYLHHLAGRGVPILRSYHGVDVERFSPRAKPRGGSRPRILSVGRLVPKKGFSVLIQALSLLRQKGHDFRCTIIGRGPMETELRKLIEVLELEDCVELLPPMAQHELIHYYASADVFALACEVQDDGDRDGIPNVMVEAMAMGIPVVSTRISGIPECVDHGVTGILVAERDPSAFADGLAALLAEPERAERLGQAGRAKAERRFNAARNVGLIAGALEQALGRSGQAAASPPPAIHRTEATA